MVWSNVLNYSIFHNTDTIPSDFYGKETRAICMMWLKGKEVLILPLLPREEIKISSKAIGHGASH